MDQLPKLAQLRAAAEYGARPGSREGHERQPVTQFFYLSRDHPWEKRRMTDFSQLSDNEITNRVAILRDNLRQLTEQAAAQSGAANEERLAERIETQSRELDDLLGEQGRRGL
jgi:hypothetical protein